jgi:hypothetical protein
MVASISECAHERRAQCHALVTGDFNGNELLEAMFSSSVLTVLLQDRQHPELNLPDFTCAQEV